MRSVIYLCIALVLGYDLQGQVTEDFSDGDFNIDPVWVSSNVSGNGVDFAVSEGELRSAGPSSTSALAISTLAVPDLSSNDLIWTFSARYGSGAPNPSGSNNIRVYLVSNNQDLTAATSGYFIQMGEGGSGDGVDLFAIGVNEPLIEDVGNQVADGINVTIQVARNAAGEWNLLADVTGGTSFISIGTYSETSSPKIGSFFGFQVNHTSSNNDNFYFDDVLVTASPVADTQAPTIVRSSVLSSTSISVSFSEEVEVVSAENISNYHLSPAVPIFSAQKQVSDGNHVILTLSNALTNGTGYTLSIDGVMDLSDNTLIGGETSFDYLVFSDPAEGDVVINEFLVSPNDDEFVELYNNSEKFFNLENWMIEDEIGNTIILPEYRLDPCHYVVITSSSGTDSLGVSGFPLFNNSSDELILKNKDGTVLQTLSYSSSKEGSSFELINPDQLCKGIENYALNEDGNSAGNVNENHSDVKDQEGPRIRTITIETADSLMIEFDEPISEVISMKDSVIVNDQSALEVAINPNGLILNVKLAKALVSEEEGTLELLNFIDCLGNQGNLDTTLYIDEKAPVLESIIAISNTELLLIFHEDLETITASDFSKFSLVDYSIDQVDETDTAQNTLLVELEQSMVLDSSYQFVINGLEDTLGNAITADTTSFTFTSDILSYQVIASNVIEMTSFKAVDTARLSGQNFLIKDIGNAASITKLNSSRFQVSFGKNFQENEDFRIYLFDVFGSDSLPLLTPALEVFVDKQEPILLHWECPHPDSLFLFFNETLNPSSAVNFSHYLIEGRTPRELFLNSDTSVFIQPPFTFESETAYQLEIEGIEDMLGNTIVNSRKYEIAFDTLAPQVVSIQQFSMERLSVVFNEPLDTSHDITFGIFSSDENRIAAVEYISGTEIYADLEDSIPQTKELGVFLSGWKDVLGNVQSDSIKLTMDTRYPNIEACQPVSRSEISITYSQKMSVYAENISHYNLMGRSSVNAVSRGTGYLVEFDTIFNHSNEYHVSIDSVTNSSGLLLPDTVIDFQFDANLESLYVSDSQKVTLYFKEEIVESSLLEVSIEPFKVQYQGVSLSDPSVFEVLFEEPLPENEELSIRWDSALFVNGLILPAYDTTLVYDTKPPSILGVSSEFLNQIIVRFSEPLTSSIGLEEFNYALNEGAIPGDVDKVSETEYRLIFDTLVIGFSYQLIVGNLTDLSGNRRLADTIAFIYQPPTVPGFHELRITEIMADPTPANGLPEVEFLEIWNGSSIEISLEGVMLEDQTGVFPFPNVSLKPEQYLAFSESVESPFIYFKNFPSLSNSGERILLRTIYGDIVDSVTYSSSWISTSTKREGGYSLELVDLETNCDGPANWEASRDSLGGTPGRSNSFESHFSDTIPPHITSVQLIDSLTARINFNEYMDTTSVATAYGESYYANLREVVLLFDTVFVPGRLTEVMIGQFMDCSGNRMKDTTLSLALPRSPVFGELMITEIMPDPIPQVGLSDGEYVELLNLTDEVIDLSGLTLNGSPLQGSLYPEAYLTLIPSSLSGDERYKNSRIVSPWVGLRNQVDTLVLSSAEAVLVELVYSDDWYRLEEKSAGGYSLEIINPILVCGNEENWRASEFSAGGTPGGVNSVFAATQDQEGPMLKTSKLGRSSLTLVLDEAVFSEDLSWVFDPSLKVELNSSSLTFPTQLVFSFEETTEKNIEYTFSIKNVSDCYHNVSDLIGGSFLRPETSIEEIYINEILFDPRSGGEDFVELYNGSEDQFLDLGALFWRVDDEPKKLSQPYTLPPQSYIALTEDRAQLLFDYPLTPPESILEISALPSLSNVEGVLVLMDQKGVTLDSIYYRDDFHSSLLSDKEGVSLERLSQDYPAVSKSNWFSASSSEGFATPGRENSQSLGKPNYSEELLIEPRTFVPGNSNSIYNNFTTISFKKEVADRLANVWIVNGNGRVVKTIARGMLIGSDEFVTWDGSSDGGNIVPMGQYLVVVEFYGGNANAEVLKKPVTVGAHF